MTKIEFLDIRIETDTSLSKAEIQELLVTSAMAYTSVNAQNCDENPKTDPDVN